MKKLPFTKSIPIAIAIGLLLVSCSQNDDPMPTVPVVTETEEANPYAMSIDEAQEMLEQILAKEEASTRSSSRTIKNRFTLGDGNRTRSAAADEHPTVHVFNFDDNGGFAIMSADKRTTPLIALTQGGELKPEMENVNFGLIVALYDAEAAYKAQLDSAKAASNMQETRSTVVTNDNGIITVLTVDSILIPQSESYLPSGAKYWNQMSPYNNMCQMIGDNHTLAGCNAISLAQLMACHRYPSSYNGYSFNWNEMLSNPNHTSIQRLIQQLGLPQNLNLNYGLSATLGPIINIPVTLMNFGYTYSGNIIDYDFYTVWQQLGVGLPVVITAYQSANLTTYNPFGIFISNHGILEGHSWLASGIMTLNSTLTIFNTQSGAVVGPTTISGNFLFYNFGWGGFCDGHFLVGDVTSLNLEETQWQDENNNTIIESFDGDFLYRRTAIINIVP